MQPKIFCQSCSMPIDNTADRGSEKDGSKSGEYCKYCYKDGAFTNPGISLGEMKSKITGQMEMMNLPRNIIQRSIDMLPQLSRWREVEKVKLK